MNLIIKQAIEILGSQSALAKACGVSQGSVHKWLHDGGIRAIHVPRIAKATKYKVKESEILKSQLR